MNINRLERKMSELLQKGYVYLKGIGEYHDFYYYAEEQGYEIGEGSYMLGGSILARLVVHE